MQDRYMQELENINLCVVSPEFMDDLKKSESIQKQAFEAILNFRLVYYHSFVWTITKYMGIQTMKYPTDMWIYQELIHEIKPTLIIETGTWYGGSALYFAHLLDAIGEGKVVTIDNEEKEVPKHPRIKYIIGDCLSHEVIEQVKGETNGGRVMVILDSCHDEDHVLKEMEIYSKFVTKDSYLIVEDTNIGHPINIKNPETKKVIFPGPMEAVKEFIKTHDEYEIDRNREKLLLTANPMGFLRRVHA